MFAGEREGHIYTRISNPTLDLVEQRIASLEGAEAGLAHASGMGSITSAASFQMLGLCGARKLNASTKLKKYMSRSVSGRLFLSDFSKSPGRSQIA